MAQTVDDLAIVSGRQPVLGDGGPGNVTTEPFEAAGASRLGRDACVEGKPTKMCLAPLLAPRTSIGTSIGTSRTKMCLAPLLAPLEPLASVVTPAWRVNPQKCVWHLYWHLYWHLSHKNVSAPLLHLYWAPLLAPLLHLAPLLAPLAQKCVCTSIAPLLAAPLLAPLAPPLGIFVRTSHRGASTDMVVLAKMTLTFLSCSHTELLRQVQATLDN
jgi:hypothetical protein